MAEPDGPSWQRAPPELAQEAALTSAVIAAHQAVLREQLAGDPLLNPALGMEVRAYREVEDWRALLLTPWMLARRFFPQQVPDLPLPPNWSATNRREADYLILGPTMRFELLGQTQQGHLGYRSTLGHYLLQPLCLDMSSYRDAEAVFAAWSEVIRTRNANMERTRRDCRMQREVSRRELFGRFLAK
ncbi:Protein of unknown function (DUF3457) [Thioflavicoccus mobilis 8321]|uniref:[NiFe]-hydrogenase assembly chaperone HybE n=1 Tax=Thioflavicoccus mobilis 8321 TaxID=765912 RepID=L0GUV1_9GAMM|nr:[NiFe]-hydrogenase assembly chaperone HybE [Thioflavicoccus mobilis]AGA89776.1 Protein of unknown function (DUF3457) [Thioflavicoccus mobilis 8321]